MLGIIKRWAVVVATDFITRRLDALDPKRLVLLKRAVAGFDARSKQWKQEKEQAVPDTDAVGQRTLQASRQPLANGYEARGGSGYER